MVAPISPTTAAAPLLFLALEKIARTPRPRLEVGYRVMPRYEGPVCAALPPLVGECWAAGAPRLRGLRPLGQALLLDRLLAGGILGEMLPLAIAGDPRPVANQALDFAAAAPLGIFLDVWA